jgi:hypothetical protein
MQSAYHNLTAFGGIMQEHGAEYKAADVECNIGDQETSISMDIAGAYPKEACVARYARTVRLKKGTGVFIDDEYEGRYPAELSLMLCNRPEISGGIIRVPESGQIKVQGSTKIRLEEIVVDDPVLQRVWGNAIYRVLILFSKKLGLEITPSAQAAPPLPSTPPLPRP